MLHFQAPNVAPRIERAAKTLNISVKNSDYEVGCISIELPLVGSKAGTCSSTRSIVFQAKFAVLRQAKHDVCGLDDAAFS